MKILAIRGKNLASLAHEFAIDFQTEPLASAGLYAICGPTGSGKSTLLDALCLALFERTPRLNRAGRSGDIPDVGKHNITPGDPCTLLRRGTADGYAEADFVGNDGVAYRARWSVRRAHNKSNGKLQPSEVSLLRISDGQPLGDHRKTETLKRIEERIGLSFEQFTRAVLLAQNDFAAFLKASDDERAELLQTLTGSNTFSQISMQAYARMKTEEAQLTQLQAQLADQQPLSPELRAEKEASQQAQTDSAALLAGKKAKIEADLRWYQQRDVLLDAQTQAGQTLSTARVNEQAAAPRHAQLALQEQVQPARPLCADVERLTQSLADTGQLQAQASAALIQAQLEASTRQAACHAAHLQLAQAQAAQAQAQPDIDQAREIDVRINTLTPPFESACQAVDKAQKQALDLEGRAQRAINLLNSAETDLATAQAWMSRHAALQALAQSWPLWDTLFTQAQQQLAQQTRVQADVAVLTQQADTNTTALADAQATLTQASQTAASASEPLDHLLQQCASINAEALAQDKRVCEEQRDHLQSAAGLWQRQLELQSQRRTLHDRQQAQTATLQQSVQVLQTALPAEPLLKRDADAADEALALARLAAGKNAQTLRTALQPEQPCPVCGALSHPYASQSPQANAVLGSLQENLKAKQKSLRLLQDAIAAAQASHSGAQQQLNQIALEAAQLEAGHGDWQGRWQAHALHTDLQAQPEAQRSDWLAAQQAATLTTLVSLQQQEAAYREALQRKELAQAAVNAARLALEQARETSRHLASEEARLRQAITTAQTQLGQITTQIDSLLNQLDGAFGDQNWRTAWRTDPGAFRADCHSHVQAWTAQQTQVTTLTNSITRFQADCSVCRVACNLAAEQLKNLLVQRADVETKLQNSRTERAAVLDGQAIATVQARLNAAQTAAQAAHESALVHQQAVQADLTRCEEALRHTSAQLAQQRDLLASAQAQVAAWLTDFNAQHRSGPAATPLAPQELKSLHDISPQHIATERQQLQQLAHDVGAAQAVLTARSHTLAQHEAAKTAADEAPALQLKLAEATRTLQALADTLAGLKLDLARDNERLDKSRTLLQNMERQAAISRVWSQLGELIGSADGKKFRNFAQQMTLDILLGYGNSHLQTLTKRYRLQRIQDSLGLLVVDQDMGGEIRSVHSLSGGESFLVSLALALALASLSSHRVRVESLFIDEGFGSLDAESLRVAMDALDKLQAQGRKVGVISHVAEMTERIGIQVQVQRQSGGISRVRVL